MCFFLPEIQKHNLILVKIQELLDFMYLTHSKIFL